MERGVVVGGLMICGSFLLAVSLNRSAVNEAPPAEPVAPEAAIALPIPSVSVDEAKAAPCAGTASSTNEPTAGDEPDEGVLPGNGRNACSQ
jgi:hypothetical protein